jgi:hypothetical protein
MESMSPVSATIVVTSASCSSWLDLRCRFSSFSSAMIFTKEEEEEEEEEEE